MAMTKEKRSGPRNRMTDSERFIRQAAAIYASAPSRYMAERFLAIFLARFAGSHGRDPNVTLDEIADRTLACREATYAAVEELRALRGAPAEGRA